MEPKTPKPMTPFDSLVTPHHLYMLKLFLPYTPPSSQHFLAIYIKFLELQFTLNTFQGFPSQNFSMHSFESLKPFMDPSEQEMFEQVELLLNIMEMMQTMQSMSDSDNSDGVPFNPMDLMKGMLSPEQQEMFDMYSTMFDSSNTDS